VSDTVAALTAGAADAATLAILDAIQTASGEIAVDSDGGTLVEIVAINAALDSDALDNEHLADTAANLAAAAAATGTTEEDLLGTAKSITFTTPATVANVTAVALDGSLTAGSTIVFAISDTAGKIATDIGGTNLSNVATSVTVTTAATAPEATTINGLTTVPAIDINDSYADLTNTDNNNARTLTDAMMDAATSVTLTDTAGNMDTNEAAIAADASIDTVVISDILTAVYSNNAVAITTAALAVTDSVTITAADGGGAALAAGDAAAVNAVAAVKTTTYSIEDAYADLVANAAAKSAAIGTLVAGASTVTVTDAQSVAQFNVLDGLTTATIAGAITDTIANLSAATGAAAIAAGNAASATITISNADDGASAAQFNALVASGATAAQLVDVNITDTASGLATLTAASWTAITTANLNGATANIITVSDNGTMSGLSVAQAAAIYDADGSGTNGSVYGSYTVSDTAANLHTELDGGSALLNAAQSASVSDGAITLAQAARLATLESYGGAASFSISDAAANIGNFTTGGLNGATNITITGNLSLANAGTINDATNSGTTSYNISDAVATIGANAATAGVSSLSAAQLSAVTNAGTVVTTGDADGPEASALASITKPITYSIVDSPADLVTYSSGLSEAVDITANGGTPATVVQANTIMAAANSGATLISAGVTDTVANALTLSMGSNDTIGTLTVTGSATALEVASIRALDTGANITTLTISAVNVTDTYASLSAMATPAALGTVVVSDAITMVQAEALTTGIDTYTEIRDTFANLMDDADVTATTVTGTAEMNKATTITVTDQITVDQAAQLDDATTSTGLTYNITDNDANIVAAYNNDGAGETAILAAQSVTDANGNSVDIVTIGTTNYINGTSAELAQLSSVLTAAANRVSYEKTVADLDADPSFIPGLSATHKVTVTDTAANLASNNSQLLQALTVTISGEASVAEYDAINSFVTTVTVAATTLTDTAANLAAAGASLAQASSGLTASDAATIAEAATINTNTAATATATYDVSDTGLTFTSSAEQDAGLAAARNITLTQTGADNNAMTVAEAVAVLTADNSGTTTIAEIRGAAADLADTTDGLAANAGSNDTITAVIAATGTLTVAEAAALMGVAGTVTFNLSDTAASLAAADGSVLNAATDITATGNTLVAEAAIIDGATNSGSNTYTIADTAASILGASTALLATDANDEVEVTDTTVTAAVATSLRTLDAANNDDANTNNVTEGFAVHADGNGNAGVFAISDSQAGVIATANSAAVTAAGTVALTDAGLSASQVTAADTAGAIVAGYNMSDTYANLALTNGTVGGASVLFANKAENLTITNNLSTTQATTADSWTNTGTTVFNISDTAARIALDQAGSAASDSASQVTVSTAATVAQAGSISEMSNLTGGYAISDTAAAIAGAMSTVNSGDAADRETVLGATSVTVSTNANVAQAAGLVTSGSEAYGIYNVSGLTYIVEDAVAKVVTTLSGADAAAITGASTVYVATNGDMTAAQATTLTALSNFGGFDADQTDNTAGIYNVVDAFAAVQVADSSVLAGAAKVTANGTANGDTTADIMNMAVLNVGVTINGNDGDDVITGTDYVDTIAGGAGADTITAGAGDDIIDLGGTDAKADIVVFGAAAINGKDTIDNFETSKDHLNFNSVMTGVSDVVAVTDIAAGAKEADFIDNEVYVFADGATKVTGGADGDVITTYTTLSEVASYLSDNLQISTSTTSNDTVDGDEAIFVINDLVGKEAYVYHFEEDGAANDASEEDVVSASELTLLAVVTEDQAGVLLAVDII
jgi:hypothetical protein